MRSLRRQLRDACELPTTSLLRNSLNKGKKKGRSAGPPALFVRSYKTSLGCYTLLLTFSEEQLFFSVLLSPDSPFLVVVSAFVPPL